MSETEVWSVEKPEDERRSRLRRLAFANLILAVALVAFWWVFIQILLYATLPIGELMVKATFGVPAVCGGMLGLTTVAAGVARRRVGLVLSGIVLIGASALGGLILVFIHEFSH